MKKKADHLKKKYTSRELAESFVFRTELSTLEKDEADEALRHLRRKHLTAMSAGQKLSIDIMSLKFRMEDYVKVAHYTEDHSFGAFVKQYIKCIGRKNYELAADIGLDEARLSQIVNGGLLPSEKIAYRLEYHSGNLIPSTVWLAVLHKELVHKTERDLNARSVEYKMVKRRLTIGNTVGFAASKSADIQKHIQELSKALQGIVQKPYTIEPSFALQVNESPKGYKTKKTDSLRKKKK